MNIHKYETLKSEITNAEKEVIRAEGSLEALEIELQDQFDCENIEEAKTLLNKLVKSKEKLDSKLDSNIQKFEDKWNGHKLT